MGGQAWAEAGADWSGRGKGTGGSAERGGKRGCAGAGACPCTIGFTRPVRPRFHAGHQSGRMLHSRYMAASIDVLSRASRAKATASALVAAGWHDVPSPLCQQTRNCGAGSGPRPSDHAEREASEVDARRVRECRRLSPGCGAALWLWREASAGVAAVPPVARDAGGVGDAWNACCRASRLPGAVGIIGVTGGKEGGRRLGKAACMGPPCSGVGNVLHIMCEGSSRPRCTGRLWNGGVVVLAARAGGGRRRPERDMSGGG